MTTRYKPQLWSRILRGTDIGDVEQFIRHTADGEWIGWEVYEDGHSSDPVPFNPGIIPMGYREVDEA